MKKPPIRFRQSILYHFKGMYCLQQGVPSEPYEQVTLGAFAAQFVKSDCTGVWVPDDRTYRIDEGHLPDYQPRVSGRRLLAEMTTLHAHTAHPVDE
jgi:hypothetical protein